jgi:hypothetical protein
MGLGPGSFESGLLLTDRAGQNRPARMNRGADLAYRKDQWISSFEDQLSIQRPHLTLRVLGTMSLAAWHQHGDEDPIKVARALSKVLDEQQAGSRRQNVGAARRKA